MFSPLAKSLLSLCARALCTHCGPVGSQLLLCISHLFRERPNPVEMGLSVPDRSVATRKLNLLTPGGGTRGLSHTRRSARLNLSLPSNRGQWVSGGGGLGLSITFHFFFRNRSRFLDRCYDLGGLLPCPKKVFLGGKATGYLRCGVVGALSTSRNQE